MPKHALDLGKVLFGRLGSLDKTRLKVEALLAQRQIGVRDVEALYAGLFVTSVAMFEAFLEDLFFGLLVGGLGHPEASPRTEFRSYAVAREFVYAGKNYLDWLPYDRTASRAKIFFTGGRPFTSLPDESKSILHKSAIIRNALAHKSRYSRRKFDRDVIGSTPLSPRESTPTGFLRSQTRISPPGCRFEVLLFELANAGIFLCTNR
ncbi:MAG: hypothetical protein ABIJ96_08425 [Elusimicrobiota bacterium]